MKESRTHEFLAEELLVPNIDKVDSNRGYMFSAHLAQCANLKHPESPLIMTNFENQFGQYSDLGFNDADEPLAVVGKVIKNDNVYYLVVKGLTTGTYDIIERRKELWLTEKYGFTFNNEVIDTCEEGDFIEDKTRLYKCHNYDEEENFMYGTNVDTIFYTEKTKTLEDAIVMSKSTADKFTSYNVEKVSIVVNSNDLLLNLSEDPDDYTCFPNINEDITNYLCVRRRINLKKVYAFDDLTLNSLNPDDEKFYAEGKVVDIDIFSNLKESELEGPYNKQLKRTLKRRKKFNKDFIKLTEELVLNEPCSSKLIQMYNNIKMEMNNVPFSYENGVFNGVVLQFTLLKENKLMIGSKVSVRFGGKGVLSEVVVREDEDMPVIKSGPLKGKRPGCFLNPLGVINRLNPAYIGLVS